MARPRNWKRSLAAADRGVEKVRLAIERAFNGTQRAIALAKLERIIKTRNAVALHDLVASLPLRLRPAMNALVQVRVVGSRVGMTAVPGLKVGSFSARDPQMITAARRDAAKLVTQVTNETRAAIRLVVSRGFDEGIAPRDMAKLIRPLIGVTKRQAAGVLSRWRARIKGGMTTDAATAIAGRERDRLVRRRALTIARTETIRASAQGSLSTWRTATQRGLLARGSKKVWITTPDDRLCQYCAPLDGEAVALDAEFETAVGNVSSPPLHPNCRCALGVEPARARKAA